MSTFLNTVWDLLNTPAAITMIAGGFLWVLNKLYTAKPAWAAYEGTIISGIKFAERMVPDNTENKAVVKLNTAINYVLKVYENTHNKGKKAPKKIRDSIVQGIQVKHEELEEKGTLKSPIMTLPHLNEGPEEEPKE